MYCKESAIECFGIVFVTTEAVQESLF